tara:strand:+ start:575 stop:793 length:219 start_codon:yes stop_codon:yes gene_type:complete
MDELKLKQKKYQQHYYKAHRNEMLLKSTEYRKNNSAGSHKLREDKYNNKKILRKKVMINECGIPNLTGILKF